MVHVKKCKTCVYFGKTICNFDGTVKNPLSTCHVKLYEIVNQCLLVDSCSLCAESPTCPDHDREKPHGRLVIKLHYGQGEAYTAEEEIVAILAGTGGGKTDFGALWLKKQMDNWGSGDYMVVSPSYPLQNLALRPAYKRFFIDTLGIGKYRASDKQITVKYENIDATIFFASADKPESLESAVVNAAHLDEPGQDKFKLAAWEAIQRRVAHKNGNILMTTTIYNFGWMIREIYDRWKQGDKRIRIIQFDSLANPVYSTERYETARRTLPKWKFDMQYRGIPSRPVGQIYSIFDENIHVIKPFSVPLAWNWHVAIDPGAVHTAIGWIAEDSATKKYYLIRSYLDGNKTTKEHVQKAMNFPEFGRVTRWVGGAGSEDQFRMDWQAQGIHIRSPEIRDVESGIDRVTALLKEIRLFIFDTEENQPLIEQFRSYSRQLDDAGQATDKIQDKAKAHFMDMMRYFAVGTSGQFNSERLLIMSSRRFRERWHQHGD